MSITTRPFSLTQFLRLHNAKKVKDNQRLGQRFHNMFLKEPLKFRGKDLFIMNDQEAQPVIEDWLVRHNYEDQLPPMQVH